MCASDRAGRSERCAVLCGGDAALEAELRSLLEAADEASGFLSGGALADGGPFAAESVTPLVGRRFGPYRPVREIGSGGTGRVFLAECADAHHGRRVALKVARFGLHPERTFARFRAEREILATLGHPSIVRLLDGGTSEDGHAYLVMEYLEGLTIERHCEALRLSGRQIVELMAEVCDAVQFAHRKLIVHHDLKPANILVGTDGRPRLLDFGGARSLLNAPGCDDHESGEEVGPIAFTPRYAAPEQYRGAPSTTATDVYALGKVLRQLLAGASGEAEPTPDEGGGVRRRRHRWGWSVDLDCILAKALRIDPAERYTSAGHLADDFRRLLAGHPLAARGASWRYRARCFLGRHALARPNATRCDKIPDRPG